MHEVREVRVQLGILIVKGEDLPLERDAQVRREVLGQVLYRLRDIEDQVDAGKDKDCYGGSESAPIERSLPDTLHPVQRLGLEEQQVHREKQTQHHYKHWNYKRDQHQDSQNRQHCFPGECFKVKLTGACFPGEPESYGVYGVEAG